jgi:hypothetical protein
VNADDETRPKRAASEIADLVATRVRNAIEEAERSAEALKTQAHDDASARRGAVKDRATEALVRIDELQRRLTRILQDMRSEVAEIAKTVEPPSDGAGAPAEGTERSRAAAEQEQEQEQEPGTPDAENRAPAKRPAEPFEWHGPDGVEVVEAEKPERAETREERTGDEPAPAPEVPVGARLAEAPDAPAQESDPGSDEFALAPTQEGERITLAAGEAHEEQESGGEHPHDSRRRRPGLFRHRREG